MKICFTKSQLTDFWNQATKGIEPIVTSETKTRGLAIGVEAKAVEEGLTKGLGDLPEYQTVNMADQAQRAVDLVNKDYELSRKIAMGEELAPQGIIPEALFKAVEDKALRENDITTIKDLATKSGLVTEATTMGQRIRTLAERNPESPVSAISDIKATRMKTVKNPTKEVNKVKEDIKKEIKKPTKEDWNSFIESLVC